MPHLCKAVEDERVNGRAIVSEVVGELADIDLSAYIKSACAKKDKTIVVDEVHLEPLTLEDRAGGMSANGSSYC